ncbi:MAG: zinc-dependent metalloprotease [Aquiluna sp.]
MSEEENKDELEEMIQRMLSSGQIDPEAMSKLAGMGQNPQMMAQLFSQVRNLMGDGSGSIDWKMAQKQALEIAGKEQRAVSESFSQEISNAFDMARLWLSEVTVFEPVLETKLLSRKLWVEDAMPLFAELSEPVANSMAKALSENLAQAMPEEFSQILGPATKFIGNAGAAIFAMQLGQAIGKLATQTVSATEIGIPISGKAGLISQNVADFLEDLETPKSEVLIYLAIREVAIQSLYAANRWLRDGITTQVREFAAGLKVELSGIEELVEQVDPNDPESINRVMEATAMMTSRTEEQETALVRIETTLALIDGWADHVSQEAARRLPNIGSVIEIVSRKRAAKGAAEKTFEILLGLELQPKLRREAKAMWDQIARLGQDKRDLLWRHPDQLPSIEEIADPALLEKRLSSEPDDFDGQLRKFLDG